MRNQMTQTEAYTSTPDSTNDYTYTYDAVGNVLAVYNANVTNRSNELYYFTQDAFGNELTTSPFSGTAWTSARTAGFTVSTARPSRHRFPPRAMNDMDRETLYNTVNENAATFGF